MKISWIWSASLTAVLALSVGCGDDDDLYIPTSSGGKTSGGGANRGGATGDAGAAGAESGGTSGGTASSGGASVGGTAAQGGNSTGGTTTGGTTTGQGGELTAGSGGVEISGGAGGSAGEITGGFGGSDVGGQGGDVAGGQGGTTGEPPITCAPPSIVDSHGGASGEGGAGGAGAGSLTLEGSYTDNWSGSHVITSTSWSQGSSVYYFSSIDEQAGWAVARNSQTNSWYPCLWSRFDWARVSGKLYFCQTAYNAASEEAALSTPAASSANLSTGCGGFSWSELTAN